MLFDCTPVSPKITPAPTERPPQAPVETALSPLLGLLKGMCQVPRALGPISCDHPKASHSMTEPAFSPCKLAGVYLVRRPAAARGAAAS